MNAATQVPMSIRARLAAMMFPQFFVRGAWAVTLSPYLGQTLNFSGSDIGRTYSTMPRGTIWWVPAGVALAVVVLFALLFRKEDAASAAA